MSPAAPSSLPPAEVATAAEPEPAPLGLHLSQQDSDWSGIVGLEPAIRSAAAALARHPGGRGARHREASIVLGSDDLLRRLNASYRGKDAATNVLSFPFRPRATADREGERYLGDVVLAAETVAREAAERRLAPIEHVQHLVVHGLLHLLGYDHVTEPDAAEMERLETEILTGLGLKDPYALQLPVEP
jgi:probable rRNA maturation factor